MRHRELSKNWLCFYKIVIEMLKLFVLFNLFSSINSSNTASNSDLEMEKPVTINIEGMGFHRHLNVVIHDQSIIRNSNAILKWTITPDFFVDVYELKRLKFEFRIDGGNTSFIDIEKPAHHINQRHDLSLNMKTSRIVIPFHLRYQPASPDGIPYMEMLLPAPQIQ
jgi:hypothetical protein